MIKDYEFFNVKKKVGRHTIFRVSIRQYLVFMAIIGRIQQAKDVNIIKALQLEVIRLCSNIKRTNKKHLYLFKEIVDFNIPATLENKVKKKSITNNKSSGNDLYTNILVLIDVIVSEYASSSITEILDQWNIFQVLITHKIITRRYGIKYQELTSITGLAKYKPQILYDRYEKMIAPETPVSHEISVHEAFKLSRKVQEEQNAEFH